jgi:enhancer of mRNA-decapping protein 3
MDLLPVLFPQSGYHIPEHCISSSEILDLDIIRQPAAHGRQALATPDTQLAYPHALQQVYPNPYTSAPHLKTTNQQYGISNAAAPQAPEPFVDPAILSVGKKPRATPSGTVASTPAKQQALLVPKEFLTEAVSPECPSPLPLAEAKPKVLTSVVGSIKSRANGTSATLTAPFNDLDLNTDTDAPETDGPEPVLQLIRRESTQTVKANPQTQVEVKIEGYTGKRSRRGGRGKKDAAAQGRKSGSVVVDPAESLQPPQRKKERGVERRERFRQNQSEEPAILEQHTPGLIGGSVARAAVNSSRRKAKKQRAVQGDDQDGWATEEATDIQGMGEFDFQGNLSKFDKRTVFNQIKAGDNTAEDERLVSFNRLPKSRQGVVSAKNLSHSENVLGPANGAGKWNSEAEDSDDGEETSDIESGRAGSVRSSRKVLSRQSTRLLPSRKGSLATVVSGNAPMTSSAQILSSLNRGHHSSSHGSSSRPNKDSPSASPYRTSAPSKPSLRLIPSNRPCPVINPIQMLEVEHANEVKLGLTEVMMTENAARGIAEVAFLMLNPGGRRLTTENHNAPPVVVVLAGNNRNGARAVAGGRHLQNHGASVVVCVLDPDRHEALFEDMHRQINLFCSIGGHLTRLERLGEDLKELESPPELIIDGLLGPHVSYRDLRSDDQATASELIAWARKSKASILAIDLPSGLDHSTGMSILLQIAIMLQPDPIYNITLAPVVGQAILT